MSSILAVKAERLQDARSLRLELAEKDALIAELKEQLAMSQAGGSNAASSSEANREELTQCQSEYAEYFICCL